jgi:hypothetical protein
MADINSLMGGVKAVRDIIKVTSALVTLNKVVKHNEKAQENMRNPPKKMFICKRGKCRRNV